MSASREQKANSSNISKSEVINPKGRFILDDGKRRKEGNNIILRGGAHYMASAVAGILGDHGGSPISNFYIGLGNNDATNGGVPGPSTGNKPVGGPWNGPSFNDWRRTGSITNLWVGADSVKIVNEMITIFATFSDLLFDYSGGDVDVREIVVGLSATEPSADPYDDPLQKPNTVVTRAVLYTVVSGEYVDDPYVKSPGGNLTVRYQIRFA